jgi:FAD:protein FMN transferase
MLLARFDFRAMGSPCTLHLYGRSRDEVDSLAAGCHAEVDRLERKYSRYLETSLASELHRSAGDPRGVVVDPETAALLDYADTVYRQSGGLFDVTSGVLRHAWDFRSGRLPAQELIDEKLECVGWHRVSWRHPRLVLPREGMELDFGGYVKEYAADRVAQLCRDRGCEHGLVDLGGDLAAVGPHPDGAPWRVGIRDPRRGGAALAALALFRGGVATSGDYERCMVVDGVRYGHILDPRTGWPVDGFASVSVVAGHCLVAGSASTVAMLKGCREGRAWLEALGLPYVVLEREGEPLGHGLQLGEAPAPEALHA